MMIQFFNKDKMINPSTGLMILSLSATSVMAYATTPVNTNKILTPNTILSDVLPGSKQYQRNNMLAQTVTFNQTASGGTDALVVQAVDLTYFDSADCTGAPSSGSTRQTITGNSFAISLGTPFGLNTVSAYEVGSNNAMIANMTTVSSIAVVLKSSDNDVPQSNFSGSNYYCVQNVDCSNGTECTSSAGQQNFELKTTVALGDPADGGVIACTDGGLNNLIAPKTDQQPRVTWMNSNSTTGAQSLTDGSANTATIVADANCTSTGGCAAKLCNDLTIAGGYNSGWFLPAGAGNANEQITCLCNNRAAIGGFITNFYWTSTEIASPSSSSTGAYALSFPACSQQRVGKSNNNFNLRCVRSYTS